MKEARGEGCVTGGSGMGERKRRCRRRLSQGQSSWRLEVRTFAGAAVQPSSEGQMSVELQGHLAIQTTKVVIRQVCSNWVTSELLVGGLGPGTLWPVHMDEPAGAGKVLANNEARSRCGRVAGKPGAERTEPPASLGP